MNNKLFCLLVLLLVSITSAFSQDNGEEEYDTVLDRMAIFSGCENLGLSAEEVHECGRKKLMEHIYFNIKYPTEAQENGIAGKVILSFVIKKDGMVSDVKVVRGLGFGCDEEALRVMQSLPRWIPAMQNGETRDVLLHQPIDFVLESSVTTKKRKRKKN